MKTNIKLTCYDLPYLPWLLMSLFGKPVWGTGWAVYDYVFGQQRTQLAGRHH